VVWQIDHVALELADAEREVRQLASQAGSAASSRTVADIDSDLEDLENQRAALERQKESLLRRQERLRSASLLTASCLK
jgi:chaperonin cofactor prefoldin